MSFTQKTYPEEIIKSAKKLEDSYFLDHVNQIDYFKKGYEAIPSLFKFCFDKKAYEEYFENIYNELEQIEDSIKNYEHIKSELYNDSSINKAEKENGLSEIVNIIENLTKNLSHISALINLKESDFTVFDLNIPMNTLSAFIYHDSEDNKSKPINSFIYKFFDHEKETTDYISINSKRTIYEFIQTLMDTGFNYDIDNCIFGKIVKKEGIEYKQISEEKINKLNIIDTISNFVIGNNHEEYIEYIQDNNINTVELFNDNTILAYAIAMDKKSFAVDCIYTESEFTLNNENNINDVIDQIMYSIVYRNHSINEYLSLAISKINFDNKDQDYINDFVKKTFIEFKKKLSKEIFDLYKDKIDNKKLSIAIVKDSNVYRLEEKTMAKYIEEAFKKYPEELMQTTNILSHFNYYKKTMTMIEYLKNTPDILIDYKPVSHYILELKKEVEDKIETIENSGDVKYDYWEDSTELLTEVEYLTEKLTLIKENLTLLGVEFTDKIRNTLPSHYVFATYNKNEGEYDGLDGHIVFITPKDIWDNKGYMDDQPNETPASLLPEEWDAEDINESGTWLIKNDLNKEELKDKMIEIGFINDAKFFVFINS